MWGVKRHGSIELNFEFVENIFNNSKSVGYYIKYNGLVNNFTEKIGCL